MKNILPQTLLLLFVLVLFSESCSKETNNRPLIVQLQSNPKANNATLPKPDHIVIVIEENHAYQQIVGSDSASYINYLINEPYTVTFPNSYAITHPSQPNYLCLYSGWNQNVTTDSIPPNIPFTTANLGRQLIDAGKSFATYSQNLPYIGYNGDSYGIMHADIILRQTGWEREQIKFPLPLIFPLLHFRQTLLNYLQ